MYPSPVRTVSVTGYGRDTTPRRGPYVPTQEQRSGWGAESPDHRPRHGQTDDESVNPGYPGYPPRAGDDPGQRSGRGRRRAPDVPQQRPALESGYGGGAAGYGQQP